MKAVGLYTVKYGCEKSKHTVNTKINNTIVLILYKYDDIIQLL